MEMRSLDYEEMPASSRQAVPNTESDEDTVRICNEQYGSTTGKDFAACVVEAVRAINHGIFPQRIPQGSSGSYFVKNLRSVGGRDELKFQKTNCRRR